MTITSPKPLVGVSACLLGQNVRYDGGNKHDAFLNGPLSTYVEYVPVCPETGIGLGVPRRTIRLVGDPQRPRAVGTDDPAMDVTSRLETFADSQRGGFSSLSGFVLKKNSPSCGMERVKVYNEATNQAVRKGSGIFARMLMQQFPLLPVEEEGRLNDAVLRENFINRVFVLHRWMELQAKGMSRGDLIEFHSAHKYLVMAHSQAAYQRLGKMLSDLSGDRLQRISSLYIEELMPALKRRVNRKRHVNVLQHIMGYLKRDIDSADKAELLESIESYQRQEVSLVVPLTLLRHYFRRFPDPYMEKQVYLQPHPRNLGLRNQL